MSEHALDQSIAEKIAFFKSHSVLDVEDDEVGFPDEGLADAERALIDAPAKRKRPRKTTRKSSDSDAIRGRREEFQKVTSKKRNAMHDNDSGLGGMKHVSSAPDMVVKHLDKEKQPASRASKSIVPPKLKHATTLPIPPKTEWYKEVGDVPQPLGNAKKKKPVVIKVRPESTQYLKGQIVYFFRNNDISGVRRVRIHKVIELGGAWVKEFRNDVTHIIVDDDLSYADLLKHLGVKTLPSHIIVVHWDPYMGQVFFYRGWPYEPHGPLYRLRDAPSGEEPAATASPSSPSESSASLQSKPVQGKRAVRDTRSPSRVEDSFMQEAPRPANRGRSPGRKSSDSPKPDSRSGKASDEGYGDALSAAIGQAKTFEHLPLDFEEDEVPSRPNTSEGLETDSEDERPTKKPKILVAQSGKFNQSDFQCMYKHDGTTIYENPNERTIEILQEMGKYYDLMQDQWRTLAYRKAVATLKKQTKRITTKEEAVRLPNIGERLAAKIEEISMTNSLCRLESTRTDSMDENLRLFLGIYGVGLTQAHKWIQQGYKTLEDLKEKAHLTKNQIIGIEHYDDFATRIPRIEVEMHGNYVQKALQKIDPGFEVTIMGSYRRKAKTSSDIDLIITKPKASIDHIRNTVVDELVPELIKQDFLKVGLATTHKDTGSKWHGASAIPGAATWRRIDLFLVPWSEMGAALIYFTGNDLFNRSIRLLARKKGMRLNQRGLYKDVMRGQNRANITEGTLLESRSEKRIFEILGVPWRSPHDRQI